ncbi:hypothetical protein Pmani_028590 [Petrolisthes manimaculis]|uniref:Uncharacterized protein n=1 Tax=Petrolisthes manimaculis TaxID=1843537 RepID=A0AAE1P0X9_9EUCA|nr:hypothetical protein Pmani_028590 [Petrolisthes manimaculis]
MVSTGLEVVASRVLVLAIRPLSSHPLPLPCLANGNTWAVGITSPRPQHLKVGRSVGRSWREVVVVGDEGMVMECGMKVVRVGDGGHGVLDEESEG